MLSHRGVLQHDEMQKDLSDSFKANTDASTLFSKGHEHNVELVVLKDTQRRNVISCWISFMAYKFKKKATTKEVC